MYLVCQEVIGNTERIRGFMCQKIYGTVGIYIILKVTVSL